ncbi:MAG: hypothetical protein AB1749_07440 [Pseudomonadota bacterium]
MAVDEAAWVEARRLYAAGDLTLAAIAGEIGVSVGQLRRRAKAEGWARGRSATANRRASAPARAGKRRTSDGRVAKRTVGRTSDDLPEGGNVRAAVVNRLYRAIDTKLKRLESRMQSGKTLTAADSERETRELGTMVRSFEKVTELAADLDRSRQPAAASRRGDLSAADAERMRREIAERLERLAGRGNIGEGSGGAG